MPKRDKLFGELKTEHDYGILLSVQLGGTPNELQLFVQTAQYDEAAQGLRPRGNYVVRALGVREHRMSLGMFRTLFIADEHPILFHHNAPLVQVHFEGHPQDVNELVLDIHQAYVSTFGPWRELARDINREKPLVDLLTSGLGLLGTLPQPAAARMAKVLAHHDMAANLTEVPRDEDDPHSRLPHARLLGIDDSYFVGLDFSVEELGKV